jgi:hypothetical protein
MDTLTLEEELDLFVHQQKRLRFQKPVDVTTGAEQRKQLTKLQVEEKSKDQLPPRG